jgi:hypothetical protein
VIFLAVWAIKKKISLGKVGHYLYSKKERWLRVERSYEVECEPFVQMVVVVGVRWRDLVGDCES